MTRAALAAFLLFVALAVFGARVHWVEEAGTAERDGYVAQAEQILRGELPRDGFRPLLYPLLVAGVAKLGMPPFAAARLISNLAAAALVWLAWAFGRRLGGPAAGLWAFALAAVNPNVWILGQHASTDMLFAALAAAALYAGLVYLERPSLAAALAAGAFLGLAAFTRSNAPFLLPALLVACCLARGPLPGRKGRAWERGPGVRSRRAWHLTALLAAALLFLIPHWALRAAVFGSPFHDENWKNLAWKLHGYPDWSYLDRVPYASALEVRPRGPAGRGARRLLRARPVLLRGRRLPALRHLGARPPPRRGDRRRLPPARIDDGTTGWLLFAGGLFLTAIAFAFFTWGRLLLLLLPIGCGLSFVPWRRPGRPAHAVALALVALLAVKTFAFRLPAFVERHPYQEVAVLRRLDASLPPGAALAGTSPFLGRYLGQDVRGPPRRLRPGDRRAAPLVRKGRSRSCAAPGSPTSWPARWTCGTGRRPCSPDRRRSPGSCRPGRRTASPSGGSTSPPRNVLVRGRTEILPRDRPEFSPCKPFVFSG